MNDLLEMLLQGFPLLCLAFVISCVIAVAVDKISG